MHRVEPVAAHRREKVIEPLFEAKADHAIMYAFAKKFGFDKELVRNAQLTKGKDGWEEPLPEDILREINRGTWTIGYSGQSPERLKLHMKNMHTFDVVTLRAKGGPCDGDYFGLPWPCWGTPEMKHPGTHILYDTSREVKDGGFASAPILASSATASACLLATAPSRRTPTSTAAIRSSTTCC